MKAILVKTGQDYILYSESKETLAISNGRMVGRVLSKENCEAIECGYDLDELASERLSTRFNENSGYHKFVFVEAYKEGFLKALEILGDKKFSETELYRAFLINSAGNNTTLENTFKETVLPMFIDNEWDVEIRCYLGNGDKESDSFKDTFVTNTGTPKLDKDGCLILRRI